jgi:hypothetical protein
MGLNAQVKSGYTIGLNIATMTLKIPGVLPVQEAVKGIHFGRIYDIQFTSYFTVQSGFLFSAKGTFYKIDTAEYSISPIYIELPVLANFAIGSDAIKISFFSGPYIAYGLGGLVESEGENKKIHFGSGSQDDIRPFDLGLNFGVGINFKGLMISGRYESGLINLSPMSFGDSEMNNKVYAISLILLFEGR